MKISARTAWLMAIVGLLAANVLATSLLLFEAHHGASAVIPNYYDRAIKYDETLDQMQVDRDLGWHLAVSAVGGLVTVTVLDREGHAVNDAIVQVTGYARAYADQILDTVLAPHGAGVYAAPLLQHAGVHDLTVAVRRSAQVFVQHVVVEAR